MTARNARQLAAFLAANDDDPQGAAMDLAYEAERNTASSRTCRHGHKLHYKHTTGGWHCQDGGLYRGNGAEIRACR